MKSFVIDVETVPMAAEILAAKLPEDLRNPVMPENIANPEQPNFQEGCPAYASIKDEDLRNQKRQAWIDTKRQAWEARAQDARQKWELAVVEGKSKFAERAALDARLGHAKLIGMKDVEANVSHVFIWENDAAQMARIRAWLTSLEDMTYNGTKLRISAHREEGAMLKAFFADFKAGMDTELDEVNGFRMEAKNQCVTYYGNTFDFPFLYRRAWLLGIPQAPLYRRGRYWDDRMVDLRDSWIMGDRNESSGGLDNMAAALGDTQAKLHDGGNFFRIYQDDPSEGIVYNLLDLQKTEHCGRKMGIIR